ASRTLEEVHLEPQSALSEHVTMVRAEEDHGILHHTGALQHAEDLADPVVDVGGGGEAGAGRAANEIGRSIKCAVVAGVVEAPRGRVLLLVGNEAHLRLQVPASLIKVPVSFASDVRATRGGERGGEAPGAALGALRDA